MVSKRMKSLVKRTTFSFPHLPFRAQKRVLALGKAELGRNMARLSKRMKVLVKRTTLPLLRLPFVAQKRILQVGSLETRYLLGGLSSRSETVVKLAGVKSKKITTTFSNDSYQIDVNSGNEMLRFPFEGVREPGRRPLSDREIIKLTGLDSFHVNEMPQFLNNGFARVAWMNGVLPATELHWKIAEIEKKNVASMMTFPLFRNCHSLEITNGELDSEALTSLIDNLDRTKELVIKCKLPVDFKHPQPFRRRKMEFADARWVRMEHLEHLLAMPLCSTLTLGETEFESQDLNDMFRKWQNSDSVMTGYRIMEIMKLKSDVVSEVLLKGLRTIQLMCDGKETVFISTRSDGNQAPRLGNIGSDLKRNVSFACWDTLDIFPGNKELLQMVHEKEDLEEEEEDVTKRILELDEDIEWTTEEGREKMRKIQELEGKRIEIRGKLGRVNLRLACENVDFSEGRAIVR